MSSQPYLRPTSALDRRTMGKYDVLCRLSTGGMSEIFLAFQKGLAGFRKIVVLKSILPDIRGEEEFVRMFLDEAKTTALFNHPNIASVFDLDVDGDTLFLAMEFVQGCTLVEMARACRQAKEPIPIGFTLLAVRDTALALHYAHTFTDPRGRKQVVIHRDVAEKNIMVTYEGTTKLLDFGIAKALGMGSGRTSVGMVKGTSGYMSPEQIRGEPLDPRSDVFSLGVVLHECLTGMRLFHGKTPEEGMLSALREEIPPPSRLNPDISATIDAVVLKSLQRDRDSRYATSLEFARAVEKASNGQMWHPEQSGELVLRHFTDRVNQTRELIQGTQQGEHTGELKVGKLLAELQLARDTGQPVDRDKTRTDPGDKPAPLPPPVPLERNRATGAGVVTNPPRAKGDVRSRSGAGEVTNTGETKEVTDPAGGAQLEMMPPLAPPPARRSSPLLPPVGPGPAMAVQLNGRGENYDDDDVGAKTIPAAVLPGGIFAPPPERVRPPPPVPSAPSPSRSQDDTTTGGGQTPLRGPNGWATYDEDDDDPGIKTTIARPFDEVHGKKAGSKLPLFVLSGLVVGLGTLGAAAYFLELGPFAPAVVTGEKPAKKPEPTPTKKPEEPKPETPTKKADAPKKVDDPKPEPAPPPPEPPKQKEDVVVAKPPDPEPVKTTEVRPTDSTQRKKDPPPPKKPKPTNKKSAQKPDEAEEPAAPEPKPEPPPKDIDYREPKPPAATGDSTLTLVMEPGLQVMLNGNELGTTPLFKKVVPTGRQVFKIYSPGGEMRTLAIDIKPGPNSARQDFDSLK